MSRRWMFWLFIWSTTASASEPIRHVVVYKAAGRFAGWPANHGIWIWGDEILVGFSRGFDKDRGDFHHIDKDKPEEFLLARSLNGGLTWAVETPQPPGALAGTLGMRHGRMPPGIAEDRPVDLTEPIDFTHPGFALTVRMEATNGGRSRFFYSYDRGHTWRGPFWLPGFGLEGVMGRTDAIIDGPRDALLFLTASKSNRLEGRPFCAKTNDGGLTWRFVSFIGPEPSGYAIMPSSVRLTATDLVTTIRRLDPPKSWIDAYASRDDGRSWSLLATPEPDAGEGNPPSLVKLADGRLGLIYGLRATPSGIRARISADRGKTWTPPIVIRDDGGGRDIGYVRAVVRPDGKVVAVYYYHDRSGPTRYLAATIWEPDAP